MLNDRIQALIKQATTIEYGVNNGFDRVTFDKKLFAELIVKECIETLRLVPYNSDREFGDEVIYQDAVKKHFGVKT